MSTDPSGILYYGIRIGDEWPIPATNEDEPFPYHDANDAWEEEYRPTKPEDKDNFRSPEWDAWREKYGEWKKTPQHIVATWSGSEDATCYYICAKALSISVDWDEQKEVPPFVNQEPKPEFDEWLKKFCERFGLPYSQPRWYLASRYF